MGSAVGVCAHVRSFHALPFICILSNLIPTIHVFLFTEGFSYLLRPDTLVNNFIKLGHVKASPNQKVELIKQDPGLHAMADRKSVV